MGPKKPVKEVYDENSWRRAIEEAPLDEENWKVKVILIEAAGSDSERIYLNKFETYAAEEKRFVIKNICKTETVFMVNQLGSDKKVKDENLRVFEEGNSYLKDKKDIPPDVFALIIKHLILKMKEEYLFIKRQRLDVKEGMRRESATMINKAEVKGTVTGVVPMNPDTTSPLPPATQRSTTGLELPEGKKFNTLLRERGEEWRDKVYVDDYPTDGPNLYVALTGFVEPFLPGCLIMIGIPLTGVIQIRINPSTKIVPPSLNRTTKRGQSQTELFTVQSLHFWNTLVQLRIQKDTADVFKNTAFIAHFPPYWAVDEFSGDPDKIYDDLCYLMYDIQDLSRQHLHYLHNMDIINIPEHEIDKRYKKYYHKLIDSTPLECITIYSVLDNILDAACNSTNLNNDSSSSVLSADTAVKPMISQTDKSKQSEYIIHQVFEKLCNTETNKKQYRLTYGEEYETHKDPIIIQYGDFAKYNTFHLGNINLDKIVFTSLLGMPVHNLWLRHERPTGEREAKGNFHVSVLLSCFDREDVETSELNRLLHILACRKLYNNRSSLKKSHLDTTTIAHFKKVYLKRSILAEPLSTDSSKTQCKELPSFALLNKSPNDSVGVDRSESYTTGDDLESQRIKFLFDCPDISELVSAAEIANNQPMKHMIDDFDYFEDFSGISAFQMLCEAFNQFNCVDYKYCEVTDCFILMFFNSHDKDGIARNEWRSHLSTPLCLQDFFDYILDEHYDWIQNEEKLYDESIFIKAKSISKDIIDPSALKSCVEDNDVAKDLLMEGSLKHQELEAEAVSNEENEVIDLQSESTKNTSKSPEKSSKKTKSPSSGSAKNIGKSIDVSHTESNGSLPLFVKPFLGYDLGDRRVEVFGKDATFFSRDGTKLSTAYSLIIPMNLEYLILNITPGNMSNEFWVHRALGEFVKPDVIDTCESFRITTKNQLMINLKKQSYEVQLLPVTSKLEHFEKTSASMLKDKDILMEETEHEKIIFHSLYITWPNGMITETVHENNSSTISHIKQYNISQMPSLNEELRCISLNGEVIIFKDSGDIEVLRPDGSYIYITKYCKKVIVPEEIDVVSEDTSEKGRKGKVNKLKDKSSKASTRSSKNASLDEDKVTDEKLLEYELIIDDFEIIYTNGIKHQYRNDTLFEAEKLFVHTATDYCIGEKFSKRMDGTTILLNMNGVLVVTFPNKTRIITNYVVDAEEIYPEWTEDEIEYLNLLESKTEVIDSKLSTSQHSYTDSILSKKLEEEEDKEKARTDGYICIYLVYTIEHTNFSTVTINKFTDEISIESPNETKVVVDKDIHYNFILDNVTTAEFDGQNLNIAYEACPQCKAYTRSNVMIKPSGENDITLDGNWVRVKDSYCKQVFVDHEGGITMMDDEHETDRLRTEEIVIPDKEGIGEKVGHLENIDEKATDSKSESSLMSHGRCIELYLARTVKFFVLKRDLTCSELVHRMLVEQYQSACRWQPWCSINSYDSFGDHRSMQSILTPVHLTETEKWLMNSSLADKPQFLTYKDLKKDSGKGFYHWMRPYKRFKPKPIKSESVLPPRLPRAYILRLLEKQWSEPEKEDLKGARELTTAILRYRKIMESDSETLLNVPIEDPRTVEERRVDKLVQSLAHKVYVDLKERLREDVEHRATATITTKPEPIQPEEVFMEEEFFEEEASMSSKSGDDREDLLKQLDQAEQMSPNLQKYWRRRAEEVKEEEFYKYLLREGVVPPYFRNVLGGAIWWEMNQTAGEAVTKSERRKIKCICAESSDTLQN